MSDSPLEIRLTTPLKQLDGVGKRRAERLARLDLRNVSDLVRHLPMRYEQHHAESGIMDLAHDAIGSARGTVVAVRFIPPRGRSKARFEATLEDDGGTLALTWFNAGYLRDRIRAGQVLRVEGKVGSFNNYPQMINPRFEVLDEEAEAPATDERLRPIYPATEDLPGTVIEKLIADVLPGVLDQLVDPLPADLLKAHNMPPLAEAYRAAHLPDHLDEAAAARRRLAYNELLLMQIGIAIKRHYNRHEVEAPALPITEAVDAHIRRRFGFELTAAQSRVVGEIAADLRR